MGKNITIDKFIERGNHIHNYKYDYSLVKIKGDNKSKVDILCPYHGIFSQSRSNHLNGKQGCPKCSSKTFPMDNKTFILKSKKIHGDKYSYDLVYKNNKDKVSIICKKHGIFKCSPNNHLNKLSGCPKCNKRKKLTEREFIKRCIDTHGLLYSYSNVKYINSHTKVKIRCENHGFFHQIPYYHLRGGGCPKCRMSRGELLIYKILTENNIKFVSEYNFKECVNKISLPFDFYLPEKRICIEYDGEHHFKSVEFFGGLEKFIKQKKNDEIKDNFCIENNIKLIRIPYNKEFDGRELIKNINSK